MMSDKPVDHRSYRITSIDMLRGLAIIVMALDHVRDFFLFNTSQDPMSDPNISASLFATRWITHFCAPVFVLLAGTSAGLMTKRKRPSKLAQFLFTRGVWLIFVEWFIISTAGTFSPFGIVQLGGLILVPMQVIWAIGASMVVLSFLQLLGRRTCLIIGIAIIAGHNLLDNFWPASNIFDQNWPVWVALHSQMAFREGPFLLIFVYPVLPWIGVMSLGFGLAELFELPPDRRDTILLRLGIAFIFTFLFVRALDIYGDPNHWQKQPGGLGATIMDFLNTTKYPPSLQFLLMTLGPPAILCALADRISGAVKNALIMFGRVPFAFYVTHFFLIHSLSVLLGVVQGFDARQLMTSFYYYPKGYGIGLAGVYIVWMLVIALLYPFCNWVAGIKARRRDWWLSYL